MTAREQWAHEARIRCGYPVNAYRPRDCDRRYSRCELWGGLALWCVVIALGWLALLWGS